MIKNDEITIKGFKKLKKADAGLSWWEPYFPPGHNKEEATNKEDGQMVETECTGCEFLGNDGCWPGTAMLCLHPFFKSTYDGAIIRWRHSNPRRVVSDTCPKITSHSSESKKTNLLNSVVHEEI